MTRLRQRLLWEMAQLGAPLSEGDARLIEAMHEHPEYSHLWGRLDELSDEEIERDGVNPILHVTVHQIIENQLADGDPQEVGRVLKALMQQGLTRHEAIHRIGTVLADEIFHILRDGRPFDEPGYVRRLQQLVR